MSNPPATEMALNTKEALVKWLLCVMMAYPAGNSGKLNYSEFPTGEYMKKEGGDHNTSQEGHTNLLLT